MRLINKIVIHCSASREDIDYPLETLKKHHLERGFSDVGYHWYITKDGLMHKGRDEAVMGAHVRGHNRTSIGICYEGGLDAYGNAKDTRTPIQKQVLQTLVDSLKVKYGEVEVVGHRDLSPDLDGDGIIEEHEWLKQCPCFDVKDEF